MPLEGLRDLLRRLDAVADLDLAPAHLEAAQDLADASRPRTPRRTGALAASTTAVPTADGAAVVNRLPYAGVIHMGWPAHGIPAHPFVLDAAETTDWSRPYVELYEEALD